MLVYECRKKGLWRSFCNERVDQRAVCFPSGPHSKRGSGVSCVGRSLLWLELCLPIFLSPGGRKIRKVSSQSSNRSRASSVWALTSSGSHSFRALLMHSHKPRSFEFPRPIAAIAKDKKQSTMFSSNLRRAQAGPLEGLRLVLGLNSHKICLRKLNAAGFQRARVNVWNSARHLMPNQQKNIGSNFGLTVVISRPIRAVPAQYSRS